MTQTETKCCGGKVVYHKGENVCSSCGMPYNGNQGDDR